MKKLIASLMILGSVVMASAQQSDLLVQVPVAPEYMVSLTERCNYIVDKYWERCDYKSAFSAKDRMDRTFEMFTEFLPYAQADTVHMAIDRLIAGVEKSGGQNLLELGRIAEKHLYSDESDLKSEEAYFPFVQAIAKSKKVKGAEKARFEAQYKQLANSRLGVANPTVELTRADGTKMSLKDIKAPQILLFFNDPDCMDCRMAKARLSADFDINALIKNGTMAVLAIYPGDNSDEWKEYQKTLPEEWISGYWPDADTMFTMEFTPEIYYIDSTRVIRAKDLTTDNAITAFKNLRQRLDRVAAAKAKQAEASSDEQN
jgi:hypothetical protein